MKILFWDTETAPTIAAVYGRRKLFVSPDQVIHNGFFLCYQAAWDDGEVFTESLRNIKSRMLRPDDDKALVASMAKVISEADIVVGHNAIKFDLARLKARMAYYGMKPFEAPQVVDTLKQCRKHFMFEANSLDSVCQELGIGRKGHSGGFSTSLACMAGDQSAWDALLEYGEQDVILVRELYNRIKPYIDHPNTNLLDEGAVTCCPKCQGKIQWRGSAFTQTMRYAKFVCKACGSWGRERRNNLDKEKRDSIVRAI